MTEQAKPNPLDEVVQDPQATSLDRVLATAPSLVTDSDLDAVIGRMREQRTQFIQLEAKKQAKKEGVEDGSEQERFGMDNDSSDAAPE